MINVLVTGGAGFIGSNFVRHALAAHPDWRVTTLDKLTYAGRRENLHDVIDNPRHTFVHGDIADAAVVGAAGARGRLRRPLRRRNARRPLDPRGRRVHQDRRLSARSCCSKRRAQAPNLKRFVQISTDEVYGSVPEGSSVETDELKPRNPYSASKAGADRLAYSFWATYGVPVIVTRASNNYGPYQFPEKVIPLFITNLIDGLPVPLYGDGLNVRDWLHVEDHCRAVDLLLERRAARRGLQRRRRQRGEERRSHRPPARARGPAEAPDPAGRGSPRPRSPSKSGRRAPEPTPGLHATEKAARAQR